MERTVFLITGLIITLNIVWGILFSIQLPFFPLEAMKKGASPSDFDPVLGIVHLAEMIASPFVSKLVRRFGLRIIFILGVTLLSVASNTFGFLVFLNNTAEFLVAAYILRIMEGFAGALLWPAMLSILLIRLYILLLLFL